jgi:hypothetical protein
MRKCRVYLLISLILAFASINIFAQRTIDNGTTKTEKTPIEMQQEGKGIRACCPPIWDESFTKYFRVHQLPNKNITDTYGVEFLPNSAMDTQMKAYAPYAGLYAPAGWTANSVLLVAEMRQVASPTIPAFNASTTVVNTVNLGIRNEHALRAWWTNSGSGIWNGPFANATTAGCAVVPWERMYMDGICSKAPNHMKPNTWYMIRLKLQLASVKDGVPNSWRQDDISCSTKGYRYVGIAVQNASFKAAPNAKPVDAAKIVEIN